tara:strand:+ start:2504 stop:7195 length:4692 start_codon:yes stop_codon:yes gene_type:complete
MLKRAISSFFQFNKVYYRQNSLISRKYFSIYNFSDRHVGTNKQNLDQLSKFIGYNDTNSLIKDTIPSNIRSTPIDGTSTSLNKVPEFGLSEHSALKKLEEIFNKNNVDKNRSFLGMGYYDTITPPVLVRNFLENPAWYTPYTPYQAEIAQGRLESLFNYQTMISSLTGLPYANSSLLDEASAAVEAFMISYSIRKKNAPTTYLIDINAHPQIKELIKTRASCFPDIKLEINHIEKHNYKDYPVFGIFIQYPDTNGVIYNSNLLEIFIKRFKSNTNPPIITMATDLLALTLIKPPGEIGADIALGNSQRFGVPLGCGGPHAAFFATTKELLRKMPGRIIGMTRHAGQSSPYPTSFRMTLQTREQHIRRAKATSNICTAQALLANLAVNYAIYHGPAGLKSIAMNIHQKMQQFVDLFKYNNKGFIVNNSGSFFDTINIKIPNHFANNLNVVDQVKQLTGFNIRIIDCKNIGISFDETTEHKNLLDLYHAITGNPINNIQLTHQTLHAKPLVPEPNIRTTPFLTHPIFNKYHTETEMMRYLHRLQSKDLGLQNSMIPLGSCTMKLNAAAEMIPLTWKNVSKVHPYAPDSDKRGYIELTDKLREWLADITGFADVSLQPNSGATGEYTGLLVISAYLASIGQGHRNICLIPDSAHGTNPASATIAGYNIVTISTDKEGNVDYSDLENKVKKYENELAAIMITYPSTFGVFEEKVVEICNLIHKAGGQVYMDGANMNAQVGITSPGEIGADVCHLNLHKTFCISEGSMVTLGNGNSIPIEKMVSNENYNKIMSYNEEKKGIIQSTVTHKFYTGKKECIKITLQDGRNIICTRDHKILTTEGWKEAENLTEHDCIIVSGMQGIEDRLENDILENFFQKKYGQYDFRMDNYTEREKTLAFFRLAGYASSDGSLYERKNKKGQFRLPVYLGTKLDCEMLLNDIELITNKRPAIYDSGKVYVVQFPAELAHAVSCVPGMIIGKKTDSKNLLPDVINSDTTPKSVLKEYFGGLFGGDGVSPCIVHLKNNPDTMKEVRYIQTRSDKEILTKYMEEIQVGLDRLGVKSYVCKIKTPSKKSTYYNEKELRFIGILTVLWGTSFAKNIGFRYCSHKSARLAAATAWWGMKETVKTQRISVATKALESKTNDNNWETTVKRAYMEESEITPIINEYYASFGRNKNVTKQQLTVAINGCGRKNISKERESHKRANFPPVTKKGVETGIPTLRGFLKSIGAIDWFSTHTKKGTKYTITYSTNRETEEYPKLNLRVVGKRNVGEKKVYDLTVKDTHNFIANNIVVHNCIPHGGGGPGMGPIGVAKHLVDFLPGNPNVQRKNLNNTNIGDAGGNIKVGKPIGPVAAAMWGSASILPISYQYIAMMGAQGLLHATRSAIVNANYMMVRLKDHYPIVYTNEKGRIAHEFIIDIRKIHKKVGITAIDVSKRLQDYGFHGPTNSWPIPNTMMIEPTESENKEEMDKYCDALIEIRKEIQEIIDIYEKDPENKEILENNLLKNAPHSLHMLSDDNWNFPYTRERAGYPLPWLKEHKHWPTIGRVDESYGDKILVTNWYQFDENNKNK